MSSTSNKWHETSANDYPPADPNNSTSTADLFPGQSEPKSELARYRLLSPTAAVRVSPICLGAMSLGDQWTGAMAGKLDAKESEEYLDVYYEASETSLGAVGPTLIKYRREVILSILPMRTRTSNRNISSENGWKSEATEMRLSLQRASKNIHIFPVADRGSKYSSYGKNRQGERFPGIGVNFVGNAKKNLRVTVDESLKRLRTDYIDLLYVHWWDHSTSVPELMQSLNDLVRLGKVLYLGISDTPAWVVSQANEYARQNGLAQFVV